jgi:hypothetical protein
LPSELASECFEGSWNVRTTAAAAAGNTSAAHSYYTKLVELAEGSDGTRPEIVQAKAYLQQANK